MENLKSIEEELETEEVSKVEPIQIVKPTINVPIKEKGKKRNFIIPILLIVLLLGVGGYYAYNWLQADISEKEAAAFSLGAQYGYKSSLLEIFDKAVTCQPVQLTKDGLMINLLETRCLSG